MGSTTKVKVSEIFSQAGSAFSRLGELTMQLQTTEDGSSKWTDEEIDMLNAAISRFCRDLSEISLRIKNRGIAQLKQTLKKKAFDDSGIPVKQVAYVSTAAQPIAVPVQHSIHNLPTASQSMPIQMQYVHQVTPGTSTGSASIQHVQQMQTIPQYQQIQQPQQFQFVQQIQPVQTLSSAIPLLAPISGAQSSKCDVEVTEISTDDQQDDSQDELVPHLILTGGGTISTTTTASGTIPTNSTVLINNDQSMLTLNRLNANHHELNDDVGIDSVDEATTDDDHPTSHDFGGGDSSVDEQQQLQSQRG